MDLIIGCKTSSTFEVIDFAKNNNTGIEVKCFSSPFTFASDWHGLLEVIKKQLKGFKGVLSLQGVNINRPPSWDRMVVKRVKDEYEKSLLVAEEINAQSVIYNSNYFPGLTSWKYKDWLAVQVDLWGQIASSAQQKGITIAIENIYDEKPTSILDILKEVKSPNLKGCIDFGHLNLISNKKDFKEWIGLFSEDIYCTHLHNNNGRYDSHKSLLKGSVDYEAIFLELKNMKDLPIFAVEVNSLSDAVESIDYVKQLANKYFSAS